MKNIYALVCICFVCINKDALAQNVGIGTATPAEKLTVAGNVQADSFKYATPKTSYYSVNEAAFKARLGSETVYTSFGNGGAYITNGGNYGLTAPVNLPHNAVITQITVQFYDASATQDLTAYFVRAYTSGFGFDATINSSGNGGLNTQVFTFPTPYMIDNSNSSYEFFVVPASGVWNTADLAIRSVIFQYTVSETN